jgi:hypothetical protein
MKSLSRYLAVTVIAVAGSVASLDGSPPDNPTLLFHNDGTRSLRIYVDNLYLGTVGAARRTCFRMPFRPGLAQLEAKTPNGRQSVLSPPVSLDESEGWYWRIGISPERDAKLTLRPAERCQTR